MKKIIIILSILAGVALILIGFYKIFFASKVPQAFIDKHNEIASLEKEAAKVSDLNSMPEWSTLDKQMNDKKYTDVLKIIDSALGRKKDAAVKLDSIDKKLVELKSMLGEITDSKIKTSAEKFLEIAKKENAAKISYNNLQVKMLEKMKAMVGILEKNPQTMSVADEKTVNDLIKQIDDLKIQIAAAEKEMNGAQSQYKETEKEFFSLAGLEIAK
ncbi:MAG: hypothetical protein V1804_01520 [Patescibacteria group bacterium]